MSNPESMPEKNNINSEHDQNSVQTESCSTTGGCGPTIAGIPVIRLIIVVFFLLMAVVAARGQVVQDNPAHAQLIDVVEHLGERVDLDLPVVDANGDTVALGSQFADELPVVLVFHYSDCPMLCSLVLNGVSEATRTSDLVPGEDYRILTLSVDPNEPSQRSGASEKRFNSELPESRVGNPWRFFTADSTTINALTDQVGFKYFYDAKRKEFMHPAVIQVLTPDGTIARYLYGIEYKPKDFRLGIVEGSQGRIGTTVDRILLYCMHYDPDAEGYVMVAGQVMKLGGAVTLLIFGFALGVLWVKDKARNRNTSSETLSS